MTRRIRNCVCAWLRRYNKSLRGNVIQICSSLQINFYNLHKGVWRINYSKYNNNNIVATKEVSLKSASKKRNPLVIVLLFHGVCNIKIELNLTNSPLKIASLQKCLLFIFPNPINVVFAIVSSAGRFLESHGWWWSNTDNVAYRKFLRFYFRRQKVQN